MPAKYQEIWEPRPPPVRQVRRRGEWAEQWSGMPIGIWGKYCVRAQLMFPNEWVRSHPLRARHTAQQMASDLKHWKKLSFLKNERLPYGKKDGYFETFSGHDADWDGLENWYIWTKWVPTSARAKRDAKSAALEQQKEKDATERPSRKPAKRTVRTPVPEPLDFRRGRRPVGPE